MTTGRREGCLSTYGLDKVLRHSRWGAPVDARHLKHLDTCPRCKSEVEQAVRIEEFFRQEVVPGTARNVAGAKAGGVTARYRRWAPVAAVGAVLAVVGFVALTREYPQERDLARSTTQGSQVKQATSNGSMPSGYVGTKSSVGLMLYVKRNDRVFHHREGEPLRGGDMVRVVPVSAEHGFLLLLYRDSDGEVQVVHPWEETESSPISKPSSPLAGSLILDPNPGIEYVLGFFSDSAVPAKSAVEWVRDHHPRLESVHAKVGDIPVEIVVKSIKKEAQ